MIDCDLSCQNNLVYAAAGLAAGINLAVAAVCYWPTRKFKSLQRDEKSVWASSREDVQERPGAFPELPADLRRHGAPLAGAGVEERPATNLQRRAANTAAMPSMPSLGVSSLDSPGWHKPQPGLLEGLQ